MRIETKSIDDLIPAPYNPRKDLKPGDPEYEKLKKSITEFDYIDPVIWNERTGRVVGGHQRLKILREMGHKDIAVSVVDLPEDKEKALNLALNKTGGDWDLPSLKDLLEELDTGDFDIEITGFDIGEIKELATQFDVDGDIVEDEPPEPPEVPITKPGDLWLLGRHRLLCGDATIFSDTERLTGGKMADMVFTDPPYNVDYEGKTKDSLKIKNDKMKDDKFYQFLHDCFVNMFAVTIPGGGIYICHADSEGINFRTAMVNAGWLCKQCIIWAKNSIVMGRQDYHWKHEPILYGWKPGAAHKWCADRKQSTLIDDYAGVVVHEDNGETFITFTEGLKQLTIKVPSYEVVRVGDDADTTVWRIEKPLRNGEHPTMKPVSIPARAIKNSCKGDGIVLDLFGGSGSTLIAAEQTGRVCYTMELDPKYCDVIVYRWENLTGQKAVLGG